MYNNNQNNFSNNQLTSKYFRITAYHPKLNVTVIMDSNGKFDKLWQFSAYMIEKGFNILEADKNGQFLDISITKLTEQEPDKLILRANVIGKPNYIEQTINGIIYKAIEVEGKIYIPDSNAQ